MKKRSAYLAIDFGTSNVHASVIDAETTRIIVNTNKKYGWYYPAQNQVELHIDETWKASEWAVGEVIRQLPGGCRSCWPSRFPILATASRRSTKRAKRCMA